MLSDLEQQELRTQEFGLAGFDRCDERGDRLGVEPNATKAKVVERPAQIPRLVRLVMQSSSPHFDRNSSSYCTPEVRAWLAAHPQVHFHYTPTRPSWLNQVEGFFGILAKQSLSRADHTSKKALRDHLAAYMRGWNKSPTPFAWAKPRGGDHPQPSPNV